jgi:MraZ protein
LLVDDKNRLLCPAEVRKALNPEIHGEAFFLVVGINHVPWLYPERYYEEMVSQVPAEITPGEDALAFDQVNFAMISRLPWDKQGRLLIPEKTLKRTGLGREVSMIGVRDHLELWNRNEWEDRREALQARLAEIALRAKQARHKPEGNTGQ